MSRELIESFKGYTVDTLDIGSLVGLLMNFPQDIIDDTNEIVNDEDWHNPVYSGYFLANHEDFSKL